MILILKLRNNMASECQAIGYIIGRDSQSSINGIAKFYNVNNGTLIEVEVKGLPNKDKNNFFGFHIHEGGECTPKDGKNAFSDVEEHFDIGGNKHPNHTGDLPSIYSNGGYAYMKFFTNRFKINDIIGRTLIIHEMSDDYKTDPSGNSGAKIACGKIVLA